MRSTKRGLAREYRAAGFPFIASKRLATLYIRALRDGGIDHDRLDAVMARDGITVVLAFHGEHTCPDGCCFFAKHTLNFHLPNGKVISLNPDTLGVGL